MIIDYNVNSIQQISQIVADGNERGKQSNQLKDSIDLSFN